jgi:anaerobic selenocysteine-containing dehydrogenase
VYQLSEPENIIYSVCLQCNTQCPIKVKSQSGGVVSKIDGSPYSPLTMLPWIDYTTAPEKAALLDGKLCPKGQSGIQSYADPYRIRKVLKRAGPRGSNKWQTIPFEQAIREIVEGGKLFASIGEDRVVPGFKDVFVLHDAKLSAAMAADVAQIRAQKMTVAEFKAKYSSDLDALIDRDHPDLGPKNNQFVFMAGRIEPGRDLFAQRFTSGALGSVNWYNHTSICELSHHVAFQYATAQYAKGKWSPGAAHFKPNYLEAEFVIFWGTGAFEANFGPTPMVEQITRSLVERNFKFAVIDPRLSKTAAKAWRWLPVVPGGDVPLALAMIQWVIENGRYDRSFLENANKAAASKAGQKSWTNASWLVRIEEDGRPGRLLRASDIGLSAPSGADASDYFVVVRNGEPIVFDPYNEEDSVSGDLFVDTTIAGVRAKSALQIVREAAGQDTIDGWAARAGLESRAIIELAKEFTSHGPKAAIDFYRGPVQHTDGYYAGEAIILLNLLVGNPDWKGGLSGGGGAWDAIGAKQGKPFNLAKLHSGKLTAFGVKLTREGAFYERSTLFQGYPSKRPWFPFASNIYQEVIPAAKAAYPYPLKILWLHMANPVQLTPAGTEQIAMLRDPNAIPLIIADDIVLGDTSMYADYVFPDLSYVERWAFLGSPPSVVTKTSLVRQPAAIPVPEIVEVDSEPMPISMESMMIAIGKALGAPGYGPDGFSQGLPFNRPEEYYLKAIANIAAGDSADDAVPEADSEEMTIFLQSRRHVPPAVFDTQKWQAAVGPGNWSRVVYVLNRGGRFESPDKAYNGPYLNHPWGKLWDVYVEPIANGTDSITGKYYSGVARYHPPTYSDESPLPAEGYAFHLSTFKEMFGAKRTVSNYWSQLSLLPFNSVIIASSDAQKLGLKEGDKVRLVSASNQEGRFDLGSLGQRFVEGRLKIVQGIRPGTLTVSLSYGHWNYGAADAIVDGVLISGDKRRGTGLIGNPVLLLDKVMTGACLTDPIGGSASFFDTKVNVIKVQ